MLENIKDKALEVVNKIDTEAIKEKALEVKDKAVEAVKGIDTEAIKEDIKFKAGEAAEFVKGLDVGNLVSEGKNLAAKIDKDAIKAKLNDFRDNAKYDGTKSLLRSAGDFLGNYPRYYIEGLIGTIQDLKEKK